MVNKILTDRFTKIILQAQKADVEGLLGLRKKIMKAVGAFGARQFVTVMAQALKDNFNIEGCNDARIPLKRIFSISLDELDAELSSHKYNLSEDHPISILSADHKESLRKLKALRHDLGRINLNRETPSEKIKDRLNQAKDYYRELDSHIRKEEEVLFPELEKAGMQEHPQNLKEEHKKFREVLSNVIKILEEDNREGQDSSIGEVDKLKEEFISDMGNHIFRETYIFYPAALEFITKNEQWDAIKQDFKAISGA